MQAKQLIQKCKKFLSLLDLWLGNAQQDTSCPTIEPICLVSKVQAALLVDALTSRCRAFAV